MGDCWICGCPLARTSFLMETNGQEKRFCPNEHKDDKGNILQPKSDESFLLWQDESYKKKYQKWKQQKEQESKQDGNNKPK